MKTKGQKYVEETAKHLFKVNDTFYKKVFITNYENEDYAVMIEFKSGGYRKIVVNKVSLYNNISPNKKEYVNEGCKAELFRSYEKPKSIKHFKHIKDFFEKVELFLKENKDLPSTNFNFKESRPCDFKMNLIQLINTYNENETVD